jgi:hypothetical protein
MIGTVHSSVHPVRVFGRMVKLERSLIHSVWFATSESIVNDTGFWRAFCSGNEDKGKARKVSEGLRMGMREEEERG